VAFYDYLFSRAGQAVWVSQNFRGTIPYVKTLKAGVFYAPTRLATVSSLGGWGKVTAKFFSPTGIVTKIENAHGYTS
jgi:ABC-type sulfate transport system substrate-binding protein